MPESTYTLGINAAFHDSAACIVRDGVVIAAAEDERFTHVKHAKRPVPFSTWELPFHAIDYCLAEAGITLADVDHVAYSYDPWFELDRDLAHQVGQVEQRRPRRERSGVDPRDVEEGRHDFFHSI